MSPLLDGENSGPQLVGGEILDQCADERNEKIQASTSYHITWRSVISLCKTLGAHVQLRDSFFPEGVERSDYEDGGRQLVM
jgi:hypothetical protein